MNYQNFTFYDPGKLIEIIELPPDNHQYQEGDRQKCRYRFDL